MRIMSTGLWFMLAGGAIGAIMAIHGMVMLLSSEGKTANPDLSQRRRSASYSICFGVSLVLIVLAGLLSSEDANRRVLAVLRYLAAAT
jgi:hypothetical protein